MEGKIIKDDSIFSASMSRYSARLHQRTELAAHPGALPCWPLYRLKCSYRYPKKEKKFFSWAKGMQKCVGQRVAVNTYKFLSHPWGYDLLNSLCVLPVRSLPWHIPVCPWKGGVCWGQSWGWCKQQSRGDEKYLRVATVQFPENSVEKVSFPLDKNPWSPPCAEGATSTEPGWGNRGAPVPLGKAGKTKSNITIR